MYAPYNDDEEDDDRPEASEGPPIDRHSQRGSLAEADAIGPQTEVLSPTGARVDDELTVEDTDATRMGDA